MNENLPPPNWSPTGNSGEWRWEEGCWKFYDDTFGLVTSEHFRKMKATSAKKSTDKKWWQKLFLVFTFLTLTANAQSPTMTASRFTTLLPREVYGEKGNFTLCFKCATCKSKKFQRLYVRYHLGRTVND